MLPGLPAPGRCLVMGVVNVTPDSFSDGGRWLDPAAAVAHGVALVEQGADLVDVGGESTRPGAQRPSAEEELRRVLPVVRGLVAAGAVVSVDTMRAEVAQRCVGEGAALVNDVSGGLADPAMADAVARSGVPYVVMHWRGQSAAMDRLASYDDVVADVHAELAARVRALTDAGVDPARLVVDPGLGFAKQPGHNWSLLAHLDVLADLGLPVLVGASRKRFLGSLLASAGSDLRDPAGRDDATAALTVVAAMAGAWCVRVHEVSASADAVRVVAAVRAASRRPAGVAT